MNILVLVFLWGENNILVSAKVFHKKYAQFFQTLKVQHKNEDFFGSDFEICTVSLLVILKY